MLCLGFDTSGPYCAVALLKDNEIVVAKAEDMSRGQAERLMPLLEEVLANANVTWQDLDRVGVGIGPGNFTGVRISVSAARGLALGLKIPALGITSFDALRDGEIGVAAVPAPRGQAHVQTDQDTPIAMDDTDVPEQAKRLGNPADLAVSIARLAARRPVRADERPAPFYLRPADAAPPRDAPPVILDDA